MAISNTSKPTTTLSNTDKVSIGTTWNSILTTWNSETQTWLEASQLIDNISRVTSTFTNTSKPA